MKNNQITTSIPSSTLALITNPWANTILSIESGSVIHAALRDQLYRVPEFIKNFTRKYNNYPVKFVSIHIPTLAVDDPTELKEHLKKTIKKTSKHLVFLVMGVDSWLNRPEMIAVFDYFTHATNCKISMLYFLRHDLRNPALTKSLSQFSSLYQNIHVYPYFTSNDIDHFLTYYSNKFNLKLPQEIRRDIIDKCGGSLWLAKEALRHYKNSGTSELFTHQEMRLKIKTLFEEMSSEEQNIISTLATGSKEMVNCADWALNFMTETNLIKHKKVKYTCAMNLLLEYASSGIFNNLTVQNYKDGSVIVNGLRVNDLFTSRELKLFRLLIDKKNKIISREETASVLWNTLSADYNDWSLDMAINRLRNKLTRMGIHRKILKTIKNKGYVFQASI